MYGAALTEANRRRAAGNATGRHTLALLAPRLTYQSIRAAAAAAGGSSAPETCQATPLTRLLSRGDPQATAALLDAAAEYACANGDPTSSSSASTGARAEAAGAPGRSAATGWLAEALQGTAAVAGPAEPGPEEAPQSHCGRRGTGPLSPLAHGVFVTPPAAVLQVLPEPVAEVLQMESGAPASQAAGVGALGCPCCACYAATAAARQPLLLACAHVAVLCCAAAPEPIGLRHSPPRLPMPPLSPDCTAADYRSRRRTREASAAASATEPAACCMCLSQLFISHNLASP